MRESRWGKNAGCAQNKSVEGIFESCGCANNNTMDRALPLYLSNQYPLNRYIYMFPIAMGLSNPKKDKGKKVDTDIWAPVAISVM